MSTRCFLQATGDYYLCPLGGPQIKGAAMQAYLDPMDQGIVELQEIHYDYADGHSALMRGQKAFPNEDALAQILTRYWVKAYLQLTSWEQVEHHAVRRYRDRPDGGAPPISGEVHPEYRGCRPADANPGLAGLCYQSS